VKEGKIFAAPGWGKILWLSSLLNQFDKGDSSKRVYVEVKKSIILAIMP
jgi:hypothetical protein